MSERLLLGFEAAQQVWRTVGRRVAVDNPPTPTRPPLLVRILFERGAGIELGSMPRRTRASTVPESLDGARAAHVRITLDECPSTLDLCVSRQRGRRFLAGARCHLMTGSYPVGSFFELGEGVMVTCPELTFLQMSRILSEELLILYGHELCGYFAHGMGEHGFCNCPALTTASRIEAFLDRLEALRAERGEGMPWGLRRARAALVHVRDGAASPEEAVLSMVLTMPRHRGGYGLPPATLNASVRLGAEAAELFGIEEFVCDLRWTGHGLVAEFQGSQHKLRSRRSYDLRKGNVLGADGWTVIEVDRAMLERAPLMDEVAKSVSRGLGLRWRQPGARIATCQARLRNRLLRHLDDMRMRAVDMLAA